MEQKASINMNIKNIQKSLKKVLTKGEKDDRICEQKSLRH